MSDVLQLVNLVLAGVLTGNELGTWAVVHPAIQRLPFAHEVRAEQEVTRRYGAFMPWLMMLTLLSGLAALATLDGGSDAFALTLAGTLCYGAMLATTLAANVPINARTLRFRETGSPEEWRGLRCRWDRLHTGRVVLDTAGLVCVALAAVS